MSSLNLKIDKGKDDYSRVFDRVIAFGTRDLGTINGEVYLTWSCKGSNNLIFPKDRVSRRQSNIQNTFKGVASWVLNSIILCEN